MEPVQPDNQDVNINDLEAEDLLSSELSAEMDNILRGVGAPNIKQDEAYLPEQEDENEENEVVEPETPDDSTGDSDNQNVPVEPTPEVEGAEEEIEIPENLISAARQAYLDDKTIVKLYKESPQVLIQLANQRQLLDSRVQGDTPTPKQEDVQMPEPELIEELNVSDFVTEDMSEADKKRVERQIQAQNKVIEASNKRTLAEHNSMMQSKADERKRQFDYSKRVDGVFDTQKDFLPVFGVSNALTANQASVRKTVHEIAVSLNRATPTDTIEQSLGKAIKAYTGLYVSDEVYAKNKEDIISKLNKTKKKFIARPRGQRKPEGDRNLSDEQQEFAEFEANAAKLGIDFAG